MKKVTVYAVATKETKCYGHGEYIKESSIKEQGSYGPGPAFFHPVFLCKEKAEAFRSSLGCLNSSHIVSLELDVEPLNKEKGLSNIAECEFARSGGWMG